MISDIGGEAHGLLARSFNAVTEHFKRVRGDSEGREGGELAGSVEAICKRSCTRSLNEDVQPRRL